MPNSETNQEAIKLSPLPKTTTKPSLNAGVDEQLVVSASMAGPAKISNATPILDATDDKDSKLELPKDQAIWNPDYLESNSDLQTIIKAIIANMLLALIDLIQNGFRMERFKGGRELLLDKLRDQNIPELNKNIDVVKSQVDGLKEHAAATFHEKNELEEELKALGKSPDETVESANDMYEDAGDFLLNAEKQEELIGKISAVDKKLQDNQKDLDKMEATLDALYVKKAGYSGAIDTLRVGTFQARAVPNMEALNKARGLYEDAQRRFIKIDTNVRNVRNHVAKSMSAQEAHSDEALLVRLLDKHRIISSLKNEIRMEKASYKSSRQTPQVATRLALLDAQLKLQKPEYFYQNFREILAKCEQSINAKSDFKIDISEQLNKFNEIINKITALRTDGTENAVYESQSHLTKMFTNRVPTRQEDYKKLMEIRNEEQIPDVKAPVKPAPSPAATPDPKPTSTPDDDIVVEQGQAKDFVEVKEDYTHQQENGQGYETITEIKKTATFVQATLKLQQAHKEQILPHTKQPDVTVTQDAEFSKQLSPRNK